MNLKGHLSEYPLRELLSILRNRRETGRLQIDFEKAFAVFHLKDGRIINATLGPLKGLAAVRVALFLKEASFAFDAVGIAVEATITDSDQRRIVTGLLGLPLDDGEEVETIPLPIAVLVDNDGIRPPGTSRLAVSENIRGHILLAAKEALVFVHSHTRAVSIAVILMLLVPIVVAIAVTFPNDNGRQRAVGLVPGSDTHRMGPANPLGSSAKQGERSTLPADYAVYTDQKPIAKPEPTGEVSRVSFSTTTAEMNSNQEPPALRTDKVLQKEASARVIAVVMHIEEGRISEAYVRDHHPGLEAFEATAIRLARQRRYPTDKVGTETIFVKVSADQ